jgi:hypothetical protein
LEGRRVKQLRGVVIGLWIVATVFICGCSVMDTFTGIKRDAEGNIVAVDPSTSDKVADVLTGFGVWGALGAGGLRWAATEYRVYQLKKAGIKDDNRDGIPDSQQGSAT